MAGDGRLGPDALLGREQVVERMPVTEGQVRYDVVLALERWEAGKASTTRCVSARKGQASHGPIQTTPASTQPVRSSR